MEPSAYVAPTRPSAKAKPTKAEIMKHVESMADDISEAERLKIMSTLAGKSLTVMTNDQKDTA